MAEKAPSILDILKGKEIQTVTQAPYGEWIKFYFKDGTKLRLRTGTQTIHNDSWSAVIAEYSEEY